MAANINEAGRPIADETMSDEKATGATLVYRKLRRDILSGELKPGQFATVRILQPQSEPAVLVPQRALRQVSGATYVFVIKNGRAEQRPVQTGQIEGDLIEINSGVAADEIVATTNVDQLSDGASVRQ